MNAIISYINTDGHHLIVLMHVSSYDEVEEFTDRLLDSGYKIEHVTLK